MQEDFKELFLMEYEDLCKKHGAIISCDCCDGLSIVTKERIIAEWKAESETGNIFEKNLNIHISHLRAE